MYKSSTVAWLTALLGVGFVAGLVSYRFGLEKGHQQGEAVQQERSKLAHGINNVVYLTLAAKKEEAGETATAERTRHLLLYGSAMDMQDAIDSGKLSPIELSKSSTDGVLSEVADYFHRHPDSVTPIEQNPFTKRLVPELKALMERYGAANPSP